VFAHFVQAWPQAPVYTALYDESAVGDLVPRERVQTSYLARIPCANRGFRYLAPLYPSAFERFDLSRYDMVISSTSAWAKGVRFRPDAAHVCFIHTVSRFLCDYERYLGGFGLALAARPIVDRLVRWDLDAAKRPTRFVANSHAVAARVEKYYARHAEVLHSPVDVDRFSVGRGSGDYYAIASRLLPYKRIDIAIEAARLAGVKLLVAGTGPAERALRAQARGSTTTMLGYIDDAARNELFGDARAVIVPGEEDLGLVPIEAAAAGRPTIAYRAGGALETVIDGRTGAFFDAPAPEELAAVLRRFDAQAYDATVLRAHAERFSPGRFIARLQAIVEETRV
jgi:glycosyltransferase involved in cell wall biosynthesis